MKKVIFIVGPTATGKTDLAFSITKKIPSVLISADSIQVYRGADIISGKDKTYPTELLDLVSPSEPFSVRDFVENVRPIVKKAVLEQKIPIIVGGTGFYIDALFEEIKTLNVPPNNKLRTEFKGLSVEQLQEKLRKTNRQRFESMNNSDVNNKRRLIRALEVSGSDFKKAEPVFGESEVLIIGLKTSMESLRKRIGARVEKRIEMGALDEAKRLFKDYKHLAPQIKSAPGYHQLFDYLQNRTSFDDAVEKWKIAEGQLAKKQLTWFKKNKNVLWYDISNKGFEEEIVKLLSGKFVPGRE